MTSTPHTPRAARRDDAAAHAADRLLLDALRHSSGRAVAICLLTIAAAAGGLALPAALGRALDLMLAHGGGPDALRWIRICVALTLLLVSLDAAESLLTATTNARGTAWARGRLLRHVLALGPHATERLAPGDLVARLVGNAAYAGNAPTELAATLAAVITPVGGLVVLALTDPWLAVAFLAGMPLLAVLLRTFVRHTSDSVTGYQRAQGEIAGRLVEALGGARTISAAGTTGRETARILEPLPELSRQGHRMWQVQGRSTAHAAMLVPLLQITVLAVGGMRLSAGELSVGGLLAASRYAVLATGIGAIVSRLGGLTRSRAAARRLADILAGPPAAEGRRRLPDRAASGGCAGTLELRDVTVVRGGRTVLSALNLTVPGGSSLAVVGRSGTGKSLLAALAGRLAEPDRGDILLDGVALRDLDRGELRRAIGYAFERPVLLGGTVGGAIAFGTTPAPAPDDIVRAAAAACADDFIRLLPDGYATRCADAPLSGGEAQRLGLARAFAHTGRLLILDDATSSLDTVTELRVGRALADAAGSRTRLLIAHRASTAARADRVAWLDNGRIRAVGSHGELWRHAEYRAVFDAEGAEDGEAGAEDAEAGADGEVAVRPPAARASGGVRGD